MTRYLLDTNVFIEAKNRHYGFDICPGFWEWLEQANSAGIIASIELVKNEILSKNDILTRWAKSQPESIFIPPRPNVLERYKNIVEWVKRNSTFSQSEKNKFLSKADPMVIAHASCINCFVVTHEKLVPPNSSKIKIPNICNAFGVKYVDPFVMLRNEGVRFIL